MNTFAELNVIMFVNWYKLQERQKLRIYRTELSKNFYENHQAKHIKTCFKKQNKFQIHDHYK